MKNAVILAAGFGSRLQSAESCKPLTKVGGLSLLEIGIRQFMRAGVSRVHVATGYQAELVEGELHAIGDRLGVAVEAHRVADCARPNGYSVIAAAGGLEGEFLLAMSDHIFSGAIVEQMVALPSTDSGVTLAIDRRLNSSLIDPEDATWVASKPDGRIGEIGKHIASYDAVDCGIFRATRDLVDAIEGAIASGKPGSLSDGMQQLADAGRAVVTDIGDAWWIDVDEPVSLGMARDQVHTHLPELFAKSRPVSSAQPDQLVTS